uniref:Rx N-terminal domain-containing protein n=1 Tax=Oryza punctata TaxID=4537 RepID=A0A0E0M3G1_ORYPU
MEATAVSLARSVLDGVLNRAGSAVADEAALLLGVRREVEFIRDELDMMRSFLKVATANPDADDTVRTWVKQVRDLAYDVEDSLLDFALFADTSSSSSSWLPWRIAERHRVAARIRELKASVDELNQRTQRYHVVVEHPRAPLGTRGGGGGASDDQQLPDHDGQYSAELAFQESDIIGRAREKAEVTELVLSGCGDVGGGGGGALGVVSVWGMGGMGKSSLVRMVYNDPVLLDAFDCDAWVTVPHPLDSADEFVR